MIRQVIQGFQRTLGIGKERFLVGHDLSGNSYYEKLPPKGAESHRPKRFVNFKNHRNDPALYRHHHLPPQWASWLSFTRNEPPSIEELHADQLRLARLQENIRNLEIQDQTKKQGQLSNNYGFPPASGSLLDLRESTYACDDPVELEWKRRKISESPLTTFTLQPQTNPDENWQPQTWNPKTSPKGNQIKGSGYPATKIQDSNS